MKQYEAYKDSGIQWLGEIPSHWKALKIKNIFKVFAGATPDSNNQEFWDGDIAWVTPADYKSFDHYLSFGKRFITRKGYESCATTLVPAGSIIFSKRAPIGSVVLAKNELCTNQGCLSCVPTDKAISNYFYYALCIFTEALELFGAGSTFKEISAFDFSNFRIPYPSLAEQEVIAAYLDLKVGQIDAILSEKEAMVEQLKQYCKSLITETVTRGLNPNVTLKDSGIDWIGQIPSHWQIIKLAYTAIGENTSFIDGDWIESPYIKESGIRYVTTGNVTPLHFKNEGNSHISEEDFNKLNCTEVFPGDILISRLNEPLGKACIVPDIGERLVTSVDCVIYRPNTEKYDSKFMVYYLNNDQYTKYLSTIGRGTIMKRVARSMLAKTPVIEPPLEEQRAIAEFLDKRIASTEETISELQSQIEDLKAYKSSVITEAVTGKVDLRDWKPSEDNA